jgi:hypothetical protein
LLKKVEFGLILDFFPVGTKSSFKIGSFENKCFWEKKLKPR